MDENNKTPLESDETIKVNGDEAPFHDTDEYKEMLKEDIEKIMEEAEAEPDPDEESEILEALDDSPMQPIELDLDVVEEEPEPEIFFEEEKESRFKLWPIILITLVFAILLIFTRCTNLDLLTGKAAVPTADFTYYFENNTLYFADQTVAGEGVEIVEYEWNIFRDEAFYYENHSKKFGIQNAKADASYEIKFRVRDSNGNWSDYATVKFDGEDIITPSEGPEIVVSGDEDNTPSTDPEETIDTASTSERLDNFSITKTTDNIINDYDNNPKGNYSLKLALEDNDDFASFSVDEILKTDDATISFLIKSNDLNKKVITIKGLNQEEVVFTMTKEYTPKNVDNWEMFSDSVAAKNSEKLIIEVSGSGIVWLDNISYNAYK